MKKFIIILIINLLFSCFTFTYQDTTVSWDGDESKIESPNFEYIYSKPKIADEEALEKAIQNITE